MKKIILGGVAAIVIAVMAAVNVSMNSQNENLSDLALANVEALAAGEGTGSGNTGPAEIVDCAGWGTGSRKICMCQPNYPSCTETSCF
jgi:hypothetical protein